MSSLVRRIQKRIARDMGYFRRADGKIYNTDGESVGIHWPQVQASTNPNKGPRKNASASQQRA